MSKKGKKSKRKKREEQIRISEESRVDSDSDDNGKKSLPFSDRNLKSQYLIGGQEKLKEILIQPTIPSEITKASEIIKRIQIVVNKSKKGSVSFAQPNNLFGTRKIKRFQFGVAQHKSTGEIEIVGPGRWYILNPYIRWRGIYDLKKDIVQVDHLVIVNVQPSEYARVTENNYPHLLAPGRHIRISGVFKYEDHVDINEQHINHSIINILQVPRGHFAKIIQNSKPYLVPEGVHCFVNDRFKFDGMGSGKLIKHGTITRFRVDKGEIGLAWENQNPVFYDKPGFYYKDSEGFFLVRFDDVKKKLIQLGSKKIVTVFMGEVGVSYRDGKLCILPPGRHYIDHPNHHIHSFMSTQQRTLDLADRADQVDNVKDKFFECETKDLVKIGIKAILIFKVEQPERALLEIGDQAKLEPLLLDSAISTLNGIIRCTTLTEVAKSSSDTKVLKDGEEEEEGESGKKKELGSASLFLEQAHDEFLMKLHDRFMADLGVNIIDLRIESFKIIDHELASQISKQAIITAKTQTELANLSGKNAIAISTHNREAKIQSIKNQMYIQKDRAETDAKTSSAIESAKAEAEKDRILAKGKADALRIQAEARAEALRIEAEAQANADLQYVKMMEETDLGKEVALLKIKARMVEKSLEKTKKVMFLDSSNPVSFFHQLTNTVQQITAKKGD